MVRDGNWMIIRLRWRISAASRDSDIAAISEKGVGSDISCKYCGSLSSVDMNTSSLFTHSGNRQDGCYIYNLGRNGEEIQSWVDTNGYILRFVDYIRTDVVAEVKKKLHEPVKAMKNQEASMEARQTTLFHS